jgi:hypothetical protein
VKILRVRPGAEQKQGPETAPLPGEQNGWPPVLTPENWGPAPASPQYQNPETGTAGSGGPNTSSGTAPILGPGLRTLSTGTAVIASRGTRAIGRILMERAAEPGSIVHGIWHCRPKTMAAHHRDTPGTGLGRAAEIQQHTLGKALKVSGTALSALGDSVVAQWVLIGVAVYVVLAFVFLVL